MLCIIEARGKGLEQGALFSKTAHASGLQHAENFPFENSQMIGTGYEVRFFAVGAHMSGVYPRMAEAEHELRDCGLGPGSQAAYTGTNFFTSQKNTTDLWF